MIGDLVVFYKVMSCLSGRNVLTIPLGNIYVFIHIYIYINYYIADDKAFIVAT